MLKDKYSGFTLLEVLLSLALIGVLASISMPFYQSFQNKNELDIAVNTIAQSLHRAQVLSQAVDADNTWGVYIQSTSTIMFQGSSYATRDENYDEVFEFNSTLTTAGLAEVVFTKLYGEPQSSGDIILTTNNNDSKTITINAKGTVDY